MRNSRPGSAGLSGQIPILPLSGYTAASADRLIRVVADLVRSLRPFSEAHEVAGPELVLPSRIAEGGAAGDHEEPLLRAVLVVVGEGALAGLELVDARAELLGADSLADRCPPPR